MAEPSTGSSAGRASGPSAEPSAGADAPGAVPVCNIANVLTVSRLVLVPVFLVAFFTGGGQVVGWRVVATGVFALAAITDHVDGNIARSRGLVTDFGKIADPIADKALIAAALIGLCVLGELSWWVFAVIGGRELGVTLLRFWVIRYRVIAASRGGKAKTLAQIIAIGLYLLPLPAVLDPVRMVVMGVAIVLTLVTGLDYLVRALRLRRDNQVRTGKTA